MIFGFQKMWEFLDLLETISFARKTLLFEVMFTYTYWFCSILKYKYYRLILITNLMHNSFIP